MPFLEYLKAAFWPSLVMAALLLGTLIALAQGARAGSESPLFSLLILLVPLGGFAGGTTAVVLLRRRSPRAPGKISYKQGWRVGLTTGLMAAALGPALAAVTAILVGSAKNPEEQIVSMALLPLLTTILMASMIIYVVPAVLGGLVTAWWLTRQGSAKQVSPPN